MLRARYPPHGKKWCRCCPGRDKPDGHCAINQQPGVWDVAGGGKVLLHPQKARQGWEGVGFVPVTSPRTPKLGATLPTRGNFGPLPACCLLVPSAPSGHCQSFSAGPGAPERPPEGCVGFVSACKRKAGTRRAETQQPGMPLCAPEGSAGAGDRLVHIVCCQGIFWSFFFFFFTSVILICFSLTSNSLFLQNAERY